MASSAQQLGIAVPHPNWHLPALVVAATWYVNTSVFLAVGAASDRGTAKVIDYPPGLLERSELLIFLHRRRPAGPRISHGVPLRASRSDHCSAALALRPACAAQ